MRPKHSEKPGDCCVIWGTLAFKEKGLKYTQLIETIFMPLILLK